MDNKKPVAKLIGENGNIYNLVGIASKSLNKAGQHEQAKEMWERVQKSKSYEEALVIISEYVDIE